MDGSLIWFERTWVILPAGCRASWFCHNHTSTTHCHSDTTHCVIHKVFVYTVCFSVRIRGSSRNVPTGYVTASLLMNLLSVDLMRSKVSKVTWNREAKHLYSSVLDVYSETRQTSQVSSNLFRSRMICVISGFQWWCSQLRLSVHL